jgi:PAS domain-containing protein
MPSRRFSLSFCLALAMVAAIAGSAMGRGKPLEWKPAEQAVLRVDDHPVSEWNLYQADKKNNRFLLQMNGRFLFVDVTAHQIFELDPSKIEHKGASLRWDPDDRPDKTLETADWLIKDVGGAYRFNVHLVAENHVLDVQIPHPLDLRNIF